MSNGAHANHDCGESWFGRQSAWATLGKKSGGGPFGDQRSPGVAARFDVLSRHVIWR
ncbi:MAG: hypothetical protein CBHOC_1039 [uncultured Caballeronia sp.]|nr:MAG: hypothetical protein CBHOC_1039 [uncultured Caballeronia sp.]